MNPQRIPLNAAQEATFAALSADTDIAAIATVHDFVPQNTAFPFVVIGPSTGTEMKDKSSAVKEEVATIDVYSDARGWNEANTLMNAIVKALTESKLVLAEGFVDIESRLDSWDKVMEFGPEGQVVRHGVVRIRRKILDNAS